MLLLTLFLSLLSYARHIEKICFDEPSASLKAQRQIEFILIKGQDEVESEGPCLTIAVQESRQELLNRWIQTHYPEAQRTFSSVPTKLPTCSLKLTKTISGEDSQRSVEFSQNQLNIQQTQNRSQSIEVMKLLLQSGKSGALIMDETRAKILCRFLSEDRYSLTIEIEEKPIAPALPPASPGTVIIVNTPPPDQNLVSLSTEVEVTRNQPVNLGEIVKNLKTTDRDAQLSGVNAGDKNEKKNITWFISID